MNQDLATINLKQNNKTIKQIEMKNQSLSFKCKRCATLCCKLGGPPITKKDTELLEKAGYSLKEITEPAKRKTDFITDHLGNLKNKKNGSCIFLEEKQEKNQFNKCKIYKFRPILCRLYPFRFEFLDSTHIRLKIIPYCMGLKPNKNRKVLEKKIKELYLNNILKTVIT
jgi:Fe-S-cluster containining protein